MSAGTHRESSLVTSKFVIEQVNARYFMQVANTVCKLESVYSYNRNEAFIRQAAKYGAVKRVVRTSLRAGILYLKHCSVLAGHLGERQLNDTLRPEYF